LHYSIFITTLTLCILKTKHLGTIVVV